MQRNNYWSSCCVCVGIHSECVVCAFRQHMSVIMCSHCFPLWTVNLCLVCRQVQLFSVRYRMISSKQCPNTKILYFYIWLDINTNECSQRTLEVSSIALNTCIGPHAHVLRDVCESFAPMCWLHFSVITFSYVHFGFFWYTYSNPLKRSFLSSVWKERTAYQMDATIPRACKQISGFSLSCDWTLCFVQSD